MDDDGFNLIYEIKPRYIYDYNKLIMLRLFFGNVLRIWNKLAKNIFISLRSLLSKSVVISDAIKYLDSVFLYDMLLFSPQPYMPKLIAY